VFLNLFKYLFTYFLTYVLLLLTANMFADKYEDLYTSVSYDAGNYWGRCQLSAELLHPELCYKFY